MSQWKSKPCVILLWSLHKSFSTYKAVNESFKVTNNCYFINTAKASNSAFFAPYPRALVCVTVYLLWPLIESGYFCIYTPTHWYFLLGLDPKWSHDVNSMPCDVWKKVWVKYNEERFQQFWSLEGFYSDLWPLMLGLIVKVTQPSSLYNHNQCQV